MEEYPLLSKAPIKEAVIDIQVKLAKNFDVSVLDLQPKIEASYTKKEEIRKFESRFEFKKKGEPVTDISETRGGYRFHSKDDKQIVQFRIDGFTFSRLSPYISWEQARNDARSLWEIYEEVTSPTITRVALRYINHINIPMPIDDFGDFLASPPIIPKNLPQGISTYLNRVMLYEPTIDVNAIIIQAFEPVTKPDFLPLIIDIDVFRLSPEGIDKNNVWELLEEIRTFKNKIFFNSITARLKEMLL